MKAFLIGSSILAIGIAIGAGDRLFRKEEPKPDPNVQRYANLESSLTNGLSAIQGAQASTSEALAGLVKVAEKSAGDTGKIEAKLDEIGKKADQQITTFTDMKKAAEAIGRKQAESQQTGHTGLTLLSQSNGACKGAEAFKVLAAQQGLTFKTVDLGTDDDCKKQGVDSLQSLPVFVLSRNGTERTRIVGFDGSMNAYQDIVRLLNTATTSDAPLPASFIPKG